MFDELIGKKFGKLTVKESADPDNRGLRKWLCLCDCGQTKIIYEQSFCRGKTISCGCFARESASKRMSQGWGNILTREFLIEQHKINKKSLRTIAKEIGCSLGCVIRYIKKYNIEVNDLCLDITGKRFNYLTAIEFSHSKYNTSYWKVRCDCGAIKIVQTTSLVRNKIISCGCYNKQKEWQGYGELSKSYWSRTLKGAIKRKLEFNITIEYCWELFEKQERRCALSGVDLIMDRSYSQNMNKHISIQTASLDRRDSSLGYIEGNVQWVHVDINRMKSNFEEEKFIDWCRKVANKL